MRKNVFWVGVLGAMILLVGAPAGAADPAVGAIRSEPAATLLLPYFEVDLSNSAGRTTRFWVNNASATAVMAHVTIWTDLSVPVYAFDIYLTGYDMQKVDMRNVLNGNLPQTASAGQDPGDLISPHGAKSQDINFSNCGGVLPPAVLSASDATALRRALTGQSSTMLGGHCGGRSSPGFAHGYVTIDTINQCVGDTQFPSTAGYFASIATVQNVLWGDFSYANGTADLQGSPLVAVVANQTDPLTTTSGNYTFYGRYVGWDASDHRSPLATNYAGRYNSGQTQAVVWRDPKIAQEPFPCASLPDWYPLGQEGFVVYDEQEHPVIPKPTQYPVAPQPPLDPFVPFAAATQKVLLGSTAFPLPFTRGWIWYDLNVYVTPAGDVPSIDKNAAQSWVMTMRIIRGSAGTIGMVGGPALQLDNFDPTASHVQLLLPH